MRNSEGNGGWYVWKERERYPPLLCKVTLLTDDDTRNFGFTRVVEDLVVHNRDHVERLAVGDIVDQNVTVDPDSML